MANFELSIEEQCEITFALRDRLDEIEKWINDGLQDPKTILNLRLEMEVYKKTTAVMRKFKVRP